MSRLGRSAIPASPPAAVIAEVRRAGARARELAEADRELHFRSDPRTGRLVIELRDLSGRVLDTVAPSRAVAIMSGEELD